MARLLVLLLCVVGIVLLGSVSGMVSMGYLVPYSGINAQLWYAGLVKPISVPTIVFPVVWSILYVMMGVSLWLVLMGKKGAGRSRAIRLFFIQLVLNYLWSIVFFGLRLPLAALIEMGVLWAFIVLYMRESYRVSRWACYLMIPYLAWVAFALVLNLTIVVAN